MHLRATNVLVEHAERLPAIRWQAANAVTYSEPMILVWRLRPRQTSAREQFFVAQMLVMQLRAANFLLGRAERLPAIRRHAADAVTYSEPMISVWRLRPRQTSAREQFFVAQMLVMQLRAGNFILGHADRLPAIRRQAAN